MRLVAVDMDGTFLNDNKGYDEVRFRRIYDMMERNHIRFAVASSNHPSYLKRFFDGYNDIIYIAANGAFLEYDGMYQYKTMTQQDAGNVISRLINADYEFVVSAENNAYIHRTASDNYRTMIHPYYPDIKVFSESNEVSESVLKITVTGTADEASKLMELLPPSIDCVYSGALCIDITANADKAHMLQVVMEQLNVSSDELAVFGDGDNDIEMFKLSDHSYAMANASHKVKSFATAIAPSNNKNGVLYVIEQKIKQI